MNAMMIIKVTEKYLILLMESANIYNFSLYNNIGSLFSQYALFFNMWMSWSDMRRIIVCGNFTANQKSRYPIKIFSAVCACWILWGRFKFDWRQMMWVKILRIRHPAGASRRKIMFRSLFFAAHIHSRSRHKMLNI